MEITEKDKNVILGMFPELKFISQNGEILLVGNLKFAAEFLDKTTNYKLFNIDDDNAKIKGDFWIEINFSKENPYREVYETGGKIQSLAKRLNIGTKFQKLHAQKRDVKNDKSNVCVSGYLQENQNIGLIKFFCEIVVPFFCDLVIFEKEGYWPRGEYRHFIPGLFESYADSLESGDEQQLTEKCLSEFLNQKVEENFIVYKELLLYKGKIKGHWKKEFWDEDGQCWIEDTIKSYIGKTAFEGLWRFKDNLLKLDLLTKIQ